MLITSHDELAALYPQAPSPNDLGKESPVITELYAQLIKASPFCVVATVGEGGLDCSPRGDAAGFVTIADERTLIIPDRRGNNRLDTLHNLIDHPQIGLIFLIPGVKECVRVRGTATISADEELLDAHLVKGKRPASVIVVTVNRIYFQCARAVIRSGLWDESTQGDRALLPTAGELTREAGAFTADEQRHYDDELAERQTRTLY